MNTGFEQNTPLAQDLSAQAATELIARRQTYRVAGRLPEACRPANVAQGWQIQQQVTQNLGAAVAGWKCALPNAGKLVLAPIYAGTLHSAPDVHLRSPVPVRFEPEIGYVLAHDLPPREQAYSPEEVDAAVLHARCALEVIASRYADNSEVQFPEQLADGLLNSGLVLGPVLDDGAWEDFALTVDVEGEISANYTARHPDAHPRAGLYWLANFLRERGQGLRAGQVVITGSLAGALSWPAGKTIGLRYGERAVFDFSYDYS